MRKANIQRYDLNKVYFMNEYNKTVSYAQQNMSIQGVAEQLKDLENEKVSYFGKVAAVINPEKEVEQQKYNQYEKWIAKEKKYKRTEIMLILLVIVRLAIFKYLPVVFRISLLFTLFDFLLILLTFLVGPILFAAAKIAKHIYGIQYSKYVEPIANRINDLGASFTRTSSSYYDAIDNLYLCSLDATQRELILLRRQQEAHSQDMLRLEKERQKAEQERLKEQRRARQATEELLAIERERERRYRGW